MVVSFSSWDRKPVSQSVFSLLSIRARVLYALVPNRADFEVTFPPVVASSYVNASIRGVLFVGGALFRKGVVGVIVITLLLVRNGFGGDKAIC